MRKRKRKRAQDLGLYADEDAPVCLYAETTTGSKCQMRLGKEGIMRSDKSCQCKCDGERTARDRVRGMWRRMRYDKYMVIPYLRTCLAWRGRRIGTPENCFSVG
jgi:hypothetical protein